VFLGIGFAIYDGPVTATDAHAHHAAQILLCDDKEMILGSGGRRAVGKRFMVPADCSHALLVACERVTIVYIEPESDFGRHLKIHAEDEAAGDPGAWARAGASASGLRFEPIHTWQAVSDMMDRLRACFAGAAAGRRARPAAIVALLQILPDALGAPVRLQEMATRVGLSESRLGHLVREHLGISFRRFVLWSRLTAATAELARGATVTAAAHAAGFADAAHLTRVFRRMLGVAPGMLSRSVTWHVAPARRQAAP
jgi:AraC-like DNA-binding protein